MRGCVLGGLVLLLLAVNGYALFEIYSLRAEVAQLRQQVAGLKSVPAAPESLSDLAKAALAAAQRGDVATARRLLDRLADRVEEWPEAAMAEKAKVQRASAQARAALEKPRATAADALERLVRVVAPDKAAEPAKGKH